MRAVVFFENVVADETSAYVDRWPEAVAMMAFNSQGLGPYALVSGMPTLTPESSTVNFGTAEAPDNRKVVRLMMDLPDIASDDVLLVFAGSQVKDLAGVEESAFTEEQLNYYTVVCNLFGSTQYQLNGQPPHDLQFQSFTPIQGVEEARQYAITGLLKNVKVEHAEQQYVPSPELVRQALELNLPLPPGFDAQAFLDSLPAEPVVEPLPVVIDPVVE